MSYIANCREDEDYNQKYLNEKDSENIVGYDIAVEVMDSFFDNIDVYPILSKVGILEEEIDLNIYDNDKKLEEYSEDEIDRMSKSTKILVALRQSLKSWMEKTRNETIVSMIEGMNGEEFDSITSNKCYKNAITRKEQIDDSFEKDNEIATCYTLKRDPKTGKVFKIGRCPHGKKALEEFITEQCMKDDCK